MRFCELMDNFYDNKKTEHIMLTLDKLRDWNDVLQIDFHAIERATDCLGGTNPCWNKLKNTASCWKIVIS